MLFTIHHASCTGGSIISQSIAAATNSVLISEINPFERIDLDDIGNRSTHPPSWDPTSILWHLTYNSEEISSSDKLKFFLTQVDISIHHVKNLSKNLILRDHTTTTFTFLGQEMWFMDYECQSSFLESLKYLYKAKKEIQSSFPRATPILSIRHPLDSYISARRKNWLEPYCGMDLSLDNYCKALIRLNNYMINNESAYLIRYEDFCQDMESSISNLFNKMNVPFIIPSINNIDKIKVTGKSGRSSADISLRPRKIDYIDKELIDQIENSKNYKDYCLLNNYNLGINDHPTN